MTGHILGKRARRLNCEQQPGHSLLWLHASNRALFCQQRTKGLFPLLLIIRQIKCVSSNHPFSTLCVSLWSRIWYKRGAFQIGYSGLGHFIIKPAIWRTISSIWTRRYERDVVHHVVMVTKDQTNHGIWCYLPTTLCKVRISGSFCSF